MILTVVAYRSRSCNYDGVYWSFRTRPAKVGGWPDLGWWDSKIQAYKCWWD